MDVSAVVDPEIRSNETSEDGHDLESSVLSTNTLASTMRTKWSYDKMASVPAVAEAFRAFAWRALCQESIMFLEEVAKYVARNRVRKRTWYQLCPKSSIP